jgi:DNA-binding CsgD family transcriptional regulator
MTALTEREKLILDLVQQGLTNSKIAIEANVNSTAIIKDLRSIKDKLGVNTKQDIIELAKKEQQA